jgi:hypothetical protein
MTEDLSKMVWMQRPSPNEAFFSGRRKKEQANGSFWMVLSVF